MAIRPYFKQQLFRTTWILFLSWMFLAVSVQAQAWERTRRSTYTGPRGNVATKNTTTARTYNGYNKSTIVTGPHGNTATRQATGSWNPDTGTWTRNATTTGPRGQSVNSSTTATRTDSGYNKSTTVTGPHGNTATRQATGSWDPETKTWTKDVTVTGPGGQVVTGHVTSTPSNLTIRESRRSMKFSESFGDSPGYRF